MVGIFLEGFLFYVLAYVIIVLKRVDDEQRSQNGRGKDRAYL